VLVGAFLWVYRCGRGRGWVGNLIVYESTIARQQTNMHASGSTNKWPRELRSSKLCVVILIVGSRDDGGDEDVDA
jgi:hypothetical protein